MERQPNQPNYGALRDSHQQALDALSNHEQGKQPAREAEIQGPSVQAEQVQQVEHAPAAEVTENGPTRPEGNYGDRAGWGDKADRVSVEAAAMKQNKLNNEPLQKEFAARQEQRAGRQEQHDAAREALKLHQEAPQTDKQIDRGVATEPQRTDDIER